MKYSIEKNKDQERLLLVSRGAETYHWVALRRGTRIEATQPQPNEDQGLSNALDMSSCDEMNGEEGCFI